MVKYTYVEYTTDWSCPPIGKVHMVVNSGYVTGQPPSDIGMVYLMIKHM